MNLSAGEKWGESNAESKDAKMQKSSRIFIDHMDAGSRLDLSYRE